MAKLKHYETKELEDYIILDIQPKNNNQTIGEFLAPYKAIMDETLAYLESISQSHIVSEDSFYTCLSNIGGSCCNCGADDFNSELDKMIEKIKSSALVQLYNPEKK